MRGNTVRSRGGCGRKPNGLRGSVSRRDWRLGKLTPGTHSRTVRPSRQRGRYRPRYETRIRAGCAPPGSPSRAAARRQSEGEPGPGRNGYWAPGCMALFHPVGRRCDPVNCRAGEHEGVRGRHDTEGNEAESGDLAKAGRVSADDRLPQRGQSERRPWPLQRRWRHSSEQDAGSPTVQTGADFFVTSGDSRSHQRDRTPVPSALRLSIAAMPMKRPPAPPSRFSIIVESTKFFVTPCTSA